MGCDLDFSFVSKFSTSQRKNHVSLDLVPIISGLHTALRQNNFIVHVVTVPYLFVLWKIEII